MKQASTDNQAVSEFKGNIKDMQNYLASAGYTIQLSHLLEAVSRYEHKKNWQTQRGVLNKTEHAKSASGHPWLKYAKLLNARTITCEFKGFSTNEDDWLEGTILLDVNAAWITHLVEMATLAKEKRVTIDESESLKFDGFDQVNIGYEEISINAENFILSGETKANGTKINSHLIDIEPFLEKVVNAVGTNLQYD